MKLQIFTIYDQAANAYLPPFVRPAKGIAIREFTDEVNREGSVINQHPKDYTLFHIGEWDNNNSQIKQFETKLSVGHAIEFLASPVDQEENITQFKRDNQA